MKPLREGTEHLTKTLYRLDNRMAERVLHSAVFVMTGPVLGVKRFFYRVSALFLFGIQPLPDSCFGAKLSLGEVL